MAADQDTRVRGDAADPPGSGSGGASPPPQAVMGLLDYITSTSLDEDYAHVSKRRAASLPPGSPGSAGPRRPRRPGRFAVLALGLFGLLVATAAVQTSRTADQSATSRASLVQQVNARKVQLAAERASVSRLGATVSSLRDSNLEATTAGRAVGARLGRLGVVTGRQPVHGPGIKIVVDDAPGATSDKQRVLDQDLQRMVNSLWGIGAEAVSINGQRLTNLTAIRQAGSAITVNFVSLERPYVVSAIGNENKLGASFLDTQGGRIWLTLRATFGLRFDVAAGVGRVRAPAVS